MGSGRREGGGEQDLLLGNAALNFAGGILEDKLHAGHAPAGQADLHGLGVVHARTRGSRWGGVGWGEDVGERSNE